MRIYFGICTIMLCLALAAPALAKLPMPDFTGSYEHNHLLARIKLNVLHIGDKVSGVAKVKIIGHGVWTYTFKGTVHPSGVIVARHHEGSLFSGMLSPDQSKIKAIVFHKKSGKIFHLTFDRPKHGWGRRPGVTAESR